MSRSGGPQPARPVRRSPVRVTLVGGLATVVGQLPMFLTGAMAVQITDDLRFGVAALGVAIASFRVAGALTAAYLGKVVDRIGAVASLRLSAVIAVASCTGIAFATTSWAALVGWLILGATANVLGQPAANRQMVNTVPAHRQGAAFGVKQSAPPAASMLAGLSVPAIGLTVGWRPAYLVAAALALLVIVGAGRRPPPAQRLTGRGGARPRLRHRSTVILLAVALGMSTLASSNVPTFYVAAAVRAGISPELAGVLLAVASAAAIATRLVGGIASDWLRSGHLRVCAALTLAGSTGLALLATGEAGLMPAGGVIALMGTWGFNGIFVFSLMRAFPETPGAATGATMPGGLVGGTVGPIVFGWLAENVSYTVAWSFTAVAAVLAGGAFLVGSARLRRLAEAPDR